MADLYNNARETLRAKGDNNFCVPLAMSVVSGMDINEVNQIMFTTPSVMGRMGWKHGMVRRKGQGVYEADWTNPELLAKFGISVKQVPVQSKTVSTVARELNPNNRYVIRVRRHALAFRHGEIQDWTKGRRHRIQCVYQVCDLDGNPLTDGVATPAPAPAPRPAPAAPRKAIEKTDLFTTLEALFGMNANVKTSGRWVSVKFRGEATLKVTQSRGRTIIAISHNDGYRTNMVKQNEMLRELSIRSRETTYAGTLDAVVDFITDLHLV